MHHPRRAAPVEDRPIAVSILSVTAAASSTVSDIILPTVAIVVTLVVGIGGAWVAYAAGFPRRRLLYGLPVTAPLLNAPEDLSSGLELRDHGNVLKQPKVLEVRLLSRGRKDIPSSAFDAGKPLQLDVGIHIVRLLGVTSFPDTLAPPAVDIDETRVNIGPSLIGKRQTISIALLADGRRPSLSCQSSLENVDVRRQRQDPPGSSVYEVMRGTAAGLFMIGAITGFLWLLEATKALPAPRQGMSTRTAVTGVFESVALATIITAFLIVAWARWRRRSS